MAAYIVIINLLGFMVMGYDKFRAKSGGRRVPEMHFMLIALAGGAAGVFAAIWTFRHKTRHLKFTFLVPLILVLQLILLYKLTGGAYFLQ